MMRRDYRYTSTGSTTGRMRCASCKQPIKDCEYRYYEARNAFVLHHRACCADDPEWAAMDARRAFRVSLAVARLAASRAFAAKWGTRALDEEIEDLEREIATLERR